MSFTIEDAKRAQRDLGLGKFHVVYIDHGGFVMAHTDSERAHQAGLPLTDCRYHYWLGKLGDPEWAPYIWSFPGPGWYRLDGFVTATGLAL